MNYRDFHDGFFEGLWIPGKEVVHVHLSTSSRQRKTAVLAGVVMLKAGEFKEGNIILDILVRDHNEITLADIEELYDLQPGHEPQPWEYDLLKRTREQSLILFEVNSSYGGTCCVLAKTVELLECRDWKKRFLDFD
jgi:hypothetical protein